MVVPVSRDPTHPFGTPRLFVEGHFADFSGRSYAVAPDGRHLVLKLGAEPPTTSSIRVVTHWLSDVRRLTRTK